MAEKNKDFENKLREEIFAEDTPLPEALGTESIVELVKDSEQKKSARPKRIIKRAVAVAAAVAVVASAGVIGIREYKPKVTPVKNLSQEENLPVYTSDYASIEKFFISLKDSYRFKNLQSSFHGIGIVANKASDYAYGEIAQENASADGMSGSVAEASSYSKTDLQVEGVDEADVVKTDGKYLYAVSLYRDVQKVIIVDPSNPSDMKPVATLVPEALSGGRVMISELYISDGMLIVTAVEDSTDYLEQRDGTLTDSVCCYVGTFGNQTDVFVYSLADIRHPALVDSYCIDGNYLSSRISDGRLTVVTHYGVPLYDDNDRLKDVCIPSCTQSGERQLVEAENISIIKDVEEDSYTVVTLIPIKGGKADTSAVLGGGQEIYCNRTDLYVANEVYDESGENLHTQILRFNLNDRGKFVSTASVDGGLLNQFSMDEYDGYFRIATTDNNGNNITVLDKDLNTVGTLKGIAPDEVIYAVRFVGSTAYVVTFRQTDPLFVIDLSDPAAPKITGELKIPGFSNMLYPIDENHLIGIGRDGDENGNINGLKLSLFDISDPTSPLEVSKALIPDYSYSPAEHEHKAFLRVSENEFIIPVQSSDTSYLCSFVIEDGKLASYKKYSDGSLDIYRGAFIGSSLFAFNPDGISAYDLVTAEPLSRLAFPEDEAPSDDIVLY